MTIAVIGAGAMGGAFAEGLIKIGYKGSSLRVADPSKEKLDHFKELGAQTTQDNKEAANDADVVAVVVKPWLTEKVLTEIKPVLNYDKQKLIIIAAGVKAESIKEWMAKDGKTPHFFLVIPNIAIAQLKSMTFIVPIDATKEETEQAEALFNKMGTSLVTEERLLGAGTTLASCGIAYAMRYIRASSEGGVELGFKADDAKKIVIQTVEGAAELLKTTDLHPEAAIDLVTTPGGVTIKGLNEMEHNGFTSAVIKGLKAGL